MILEDDPYYLLTFAGDRSRSYFSFDVQGRVLRFDSFSKILAGGLRLGWATGPVPLIQKMELHQQAWALHTSGMSQVIAFRVLEQWGNEGFDAHVRKIQEFYKQRKVTLVSLLEKHLKGLAEWNDPVAGMFIWIKLVGFSDSQSLIKEKALEKKVLMVPGQSFMPNNEISRCVRASFSTATEAQMEEALKRLASLLHDSK